MEVNRTLPVTALDSALCKYIRFDYGWDFGVEIHHLIFLIDKVTIRKIPLKLALSGWPVLALNPLIILF